MKLKRHLKIIKSGLIGISIIAPIATTGIAVVSCGKTKTPPPPKYPTFNDFTTAAEKTSAIDIVRNAKPAANGWSAFKSFDKDGSPTIGTNTVEISIQEYTTNAIAVFRATYSIDQAYDVTNDWACYKQPPKTDWAIEQENLLSDANSDGSSASDLVTAIFENNENSKNDDGQKKAKLKYIFLSSRGISCRGKIRSQRWYPFIYIQSY